MELGALGDAVTGGLYSKVFSRPTGHAGEAHPACADCGTQTVGRFCHACGNASHVHRTLLHLGEELLHGVMHFDGRTWRTLPKLFFRPGQLTREWCLGKRARYVSPLAMFLFTVFVMFMALSYLPGEPKVQRAKGFAEAQIEARADLTRAQERLALAEAAYRARPPDERDRAEGKLATARARVERKREEVSAMQRLGEAGLVTGDWRKLIKARAEKNNWKFNTGDKKLDEKLKHKLENPELFLYKLQQTFYKYSFLLVPLSIPFVAALFLWKKGFTLYDHGVFILYSLTFVSTMIMLSVGLFRIGGWVSPLAFTVVPLLIPAHMYFQLKGAYGLKRFSAFWRTCMLLIFCNITLTLFALAVVYLGVA